jgi:hypothetical protein
VKKAESLDDMLKCLGLEEDEIGDQVFEEEEDVPKEGMQ